MTKNFFLSLKKRKKQQKVIFLILTAVLSIGLVGSSLFWALDRSTLDSGVSARGEEVSTLEEKIENLEKKVAGKRADPLVLMELARSYRQAARLEDAADTYEKVLKQKPDDSDARRELAEVYFELGDYDRAEAEIKEVLERNPNDARSHFVYGLVLGYGKRDYTAGIEELRKYMRLVDDESQAKVAEQFIQDLEARLKK